MDERLERDLRAGLGGILDPVTGSHARWIGSPAAERVGLAPSARRHQPGPLTLLWAAVLVTMLLAALGAGILIGSQRNSAVVPVVASPTPTAQPTAEAPSPSPSPSRLGGTGVLATSLAGPLPSPATCPPTADPDRPGPMDQSRPAARRSDAEQTFAFDRRAGRIVLLDRRAGSATWAFDVCTNTWSRMEPTARPPDFVDYGGTWLVYDADSDRMVALLLTGGRTAETWAYDPATNRWTQGVDAPWRANEGFLAPPGILYDPVSGLVVLRDAVGRGMWAYDVEADRWLVVDQGALRPPAQRVGGLVDRHVLGYDAAADRFVLWIDGAPSWTFDPGAGAWSEDKAAGPPLWYAWVGSGTSSVYDEAAGRALFFSGGGPAGSLGVVAYDARSHRWETLEEGSPCLDSAVTYDAVNGRTVCFAAPLPRGMVAFDAVAGSWVRLLEPVSVPGASPPSSPGQ